MEGFKHFQTTSKMDLYVYPTSKFKSNTIQLFIIEPLTQRKVSKNALLPFVLYHGSKKYPSKRDFKIRLDELYGADITIAVNKRGENQILSFTLEVVNEKFLPEKEPLFNKGLELLSEIIFNPLFSEKFVEQEKAFLEQEISSLINDKYTYSIQRCYQEMCKDEAYGIFKLGSVEDLKKINKKSLLKHYYKMLEKSYMVLFVVGDLNEKMVYQKTEEVFAFNHQQPATLNQTEVIEDVKELREFEDKLEVLQGKICLGYRTGITRNNNLYYPLLYYNGILGAFPHSKLFRKVREEASLAYYADSHMESTKGLLLITAGIDFDNFRQARELILQQTKEMEAGRISVDEFEWTRMALINRYRISADNARGLTGQFMLGLINNNPESIEELVRKLQAVRLEEVIEVAQKIKLDTIYFLNQRGTENGRD